MKIKLVCYLRNNGDGSATPLFFNEDSEAEAYASVDEEKYGERLCDDIMPIELELDASGKLIEIPQQDED